MRSSRPSCSPISRRYPTGRTKRSTCSRHPKASPACFRWAAAVTGSWPTGRPAATRRPTRRPRRLRNATRSCVPCRRVDLAERSRVVGVFSSAQPDGRPVASRPRVLRGRRRACPQPGRRAGHEHRHPGGVQSWLEARARARRGHARAAARHVSRGASSDRARRVAADRFRHADRRSRAWRDEAAARSRRAGAGVVRADARRGAAHGQRARRAVPEESADARARARWRAARRRAGTRRARAGARRPLGQAPGTARLYDLHDPASFTLLLLEEPENADTGAVPPMPTDAQALVQAERIMPDAVRVWRVTDADGGDAGSRRNTAARGRRSAAAGWLRRRAARRGDRCERCATAKAGSRACRGPRSGAVRRSPWRVRATRGARRSRRARSVPPLPGLARRIVERRERAAHPRLPEAPDMVGDPGQRFVSIGHRFEECADLVGHVDQVSVVHRFLTCLSSRRRSRRRGARAGRAAPR